MMKRRMKGLAAAALLLALLALGSAAMAETLRFGTVDGASTVNMRSAPSSNGYVMGVYDEDTWMRITGESGNYYHIKAPDGRVGYMRKEYVYISSAAKGTIGVVKDAGFLNLRSAASKSSKALAQYDDGTPCVLLSESSGWYHVSVDGKLGYFDASYVRKVYTTYSTSIATVDAKNGGAVRLRTGPGTSYSAMTSLKNGSYVMILQKGDGWWKITADGRVGFMDSSFLTDGVVRQSDLKAAGGSGSSSGSGGSSGSGSSSGASSTGYAVVSNPGRNQKLYLRESPSRQSRSLGSYGNGTEVTILDYGTQWCRVKVGSKTGYMMTDYLAVKSKPNNAATMMVSHPDRTFVYLRSSAEKTGGNILMKVSHGSEVVVLSPGKTWTKVRYNGYTGYMMTRFLK